jgi:glycine/D-amino acid oxidase-like deaminating enzyme
VERDAEVVIVGGGIVGCATAYFLAQRGVPAVLVEKGQIGGQQSGRNWGFVRQQGRDPLELPLMMESNRIWRGLEAELGADVGWVQGGNLRVAEDDARLALYEEWMPVAQEAGLDTRLLTGDQVAALLPAMRRRWRGGMYTPSDGHADPIKATEAFGRAAVRKGARIHTQCTVERVDTAGGAVRAVVTDRGEIRTRTVVCAAGAWSAELLRPLRIALPQRRVRATAARTTPAPPLTRLAVWAASVAFRQRPDGRLTLAAAGVSDYDVTLDSLRHVRWFWPNYWKNRRLFRFHVGRPLLGDLAALAPWSGRWRHQFADAYRTEPRVNPDSVRRSLAEFLALFPDARGLGIEEAWARYIDATPDALPVLSEVTAPRGLVLATGFSGHGFGLGPAVGRLLAELIVDGKPSLDLHGFRLSRFAEGLIGKPRAVV